MIYYIYTYKLTRSLIVHYTHLSAKKSEDNEVDTIYICHRNESYIMDLGSWLYTVYHFHVVSENYKYVLPQCYRVLQYNAS